MTTRQHRNQRKIFDAIGREPTMLPVRDYCRACHHPMKHHYYGMCQCLQENEPGRHPRSSKILPAEEL